MKRRIFAVLAVVVPLVIFFASREAASWRPQVIYQSANQSETFLVSPLARWMICNNNSLHQKILIDLRDSRSKTLFIEGAFLKYSTDEKAAFFQSFSESSPVGPAYVISLYELPSGKLRQTFPLPDSSIGVNDIQFSSDKK